MGLIFNAYRSTEFPDTRIYQAEAQVILHPERLLKQLSTAPLDQAMSTVKNSITKFFAEVAVHEDLPLEELEASIIGQLRTGLMDKMAELLLSDQDTPEPTPEPKRGKQYKVQLASYADWTTRSRNKKPPAS
jgi:hypothetical protein